MESRYNIIVLFKIIIAIIVIGYVLYQGINIKKFMDTHVLMIQSKPTPQDIVFGIDLDAVNCGSYKNLFTLYSKFYVPLLEFIIFALIALQALDMLTRFVERKKES